VTCPSARMNTDLSSRASNACVEPARQETEWGRRLCRAALFAFSEVHGTVTTRLRRHRLARRACGRFT
jgi:hypothetical protein